MSRAQDNAAEIREYESQVLLYLECNGVLDIWSSIGAARLLRSGRVRATRRGLVLRRKRHG